MMPCLLSNGWKILQRAAVYIDENCQITQIIEKPEKEHQGLIGTMQGFMCLPL